MIILSILHPNSILNPNPGPSTPPNQDLWPGLSWFLVLHFGYGIALEEEWHSLEKPTRHTSDRPEHLGQYS